MLQTIVTFDRKNQLERSKPLNDNTCTAAPSPSKIATSAGFWRLVTMAQL